MVFSKVGDVMEELVAFALCL